MIRKRALVLLTLSAAALASFAAEERTPAPSEEEQLPSVWRRIHAETKRFAELPPSDDVEQWYKRLDEAVARLAADMGRGRC